MKDTVAQAGVIGTVGRDNESVQRYNANPLSNYVWHKAPGQPLPTGFYQNTARRAIDQTTYGGDISIYANSAILITPASSWSSSGASAMTLP